MTVETEWAYLAGVFDGEGSITYGGGKKQQCQLSLTQTERNGILLDWATDFYERLDVAYSVQFRKATKVRAAYFCVIVVQQAGVRKLLEGMMPYLVLKRERALEALAHLDAKMAAQAQREAACKYGHPRTEENTYIIPKTGARTCKECRMIRARGEQPQEVES